MLLTNDAAKHFKKYISENNSIGIKISMQKKGCSGYSYTTELVRKVPQNCTTHKIKNIDIFLDNTFNFHLENLTIDYQKNQLNNKIIYKHSKELGKCGCGESITFSRGLIKNNE